MKLYCFAEKSRCCQALAEEIAKVSAATLQHNPYFSLVLSGGSTPRSLYELLASAEWRNRIAWDKAHIFFGDERCVTKEHRDSNYRMAKEALLNFLPTPADQIHRMYGENDPAEEAIRYEQIVTATLAMISPVQPAFDFTLLGLGDDGHTASLFPGSSTLDSTLIVTAVPAPRQMKPKVARISLTMNGIGMSRNICFLVHGEAKEQIVGEIVNGENTAYPAARVLQFDPSWYLSGVSCERFG